MTTVRPYLTKRTGAASLLAATFCAAGLLAAAAPSAPAELLGPAIVLGPTTVLNGTATISGTVGAVNSNGQLTINGQPLALDANGNFAGAVNLNGQSSLTISLKNPLSGKTSTTTIPLNTNIVGPGGLIGPGILEALEQAGVALLEPLGGFVSGTLPIRVEGSVADPTSLAELKVNGQDVLGALGSDRAFSLTVPGTTKEITISATDKQGVIQTFSVPTVPAGSVSTARTVAASDAVGVRIARIRYITTSVRRTKRLRMVVTIKDSRGLLVRGATVRVRSKFARRIVRNPRVKKTNKVGQSAFLMRARNRAFGKRLVMVTVAQTPRAKASKSSSVRLPSLARRPARR